MMENNQSKYPGNELNGYAQTDLMRWIDPTAERILDLGCGDATTSVMISQICANAKLYGLTYNKEEAEANKTEVDIVYGDAHDLPWENGFFDVVFARHILEHCIAPAVAIQEINRILKIGGEAIVCIPSIETDWIVSWKDHYSVLPQALWEKLFREFGFEISKKENGVWTAYYSLKDETEHRYCLRKVRNVDEKTALKSVYSAEKNYFTKPELPISASPIAVVIHNFVVFETLLPLLKRFELNGIGFDILIPDINYDDNAQRMFNETADAIIRSYTYTVLRVDKAPHKKYKIAFYSFVPFYFEVNTEYKVRFQYGIGKPTYNFDLWSLNFDYIMCMGNYDEKYLSAYTQTIITGPLKFIDYNFNSSTQSENRRILYLPTYGELCEMEEVLPQLAKLNTSYQISIKFHHMTTYFENERVEFAKKYIEYKNIYNHTTPLLTLLEEADVVICDGSGALFDAIIACKPVILIKPDDIPCFEYIDTLEHKLVAANDIYSVNDLSNLNATIEKLFDQLPEVIEKINGLRAELFPVYGVKTADVAMNLINKLLSADVNYEYLAVHRKIASKFYEYEQLIKTQDAQYEQLKTAHDAQRGKLLAIIEEHRNRIQELSVNLNNYIGYDAQKAVTIENLNNECNRLDSIVNDNKKHIEELSQQIDNYRELSENKNKEIIAIKEQFSAYEKMKNELIKQNRDMMEDKNKEIVALKELLVNKDKEIIAIKEQFSAYKKMVNESKMSFKIKKLFK